MGSKGERKLGDRVTVGRSKRVYVIMAFVRPPEPNVLNEPTTAYLWRERKGLIRGNATRCVRLERLRVVK